MISVKIEKRGGVGGGLKKRRKEGSKEIEKGGKGGIEMPRGLSKDQVREGAKGWMEGREIERGKEKEGRGGV